MSLLVSKPVQVVLEIAQHIVPANGVICKDERHAECDWKTILQQGLSTLYPEIKISESKPHDNKIIFTITYTNRPARKADVADKLDQFFRYNPMMAVRSVKIG